MANPYETYPLISLSNVLITFIACAVGAPCGIVLVWRTYFHDYSLSFQIRLQICCWTFALTNILILTFYLLFCLFFTEDADILKYPMDTFYEMLIHRISDSTPEYDNRKIFVMNALYMLSAHSCTLSVTFMLVDRCVALVWPVYYNKNTKFYLLCACILLISLWFMFISIKLALNDWLIVGQVKCATVACSFPITIENMLTFKITFTVINFIMAVVFCFLLWKRNRRQPTLMHHSSHQFAQRANFIAAWSVITELIFNLIPIYSVGLSYFFGFTFLLYNGQFVMSGIALDGLFTMLLYIKIIVLKRNRIVIKNGSVAFNNSSY